MAPLRAYGLWGFVIDSESVVCSVLECEGGPRGICQVVDGVCKSRMADDSKDGDGP
jgi:hypothetical protein